MKALEILDNLEKEAKNEEKEAERLAEIDFDAMEEDISAPIGKYFTFLFQILLLAQKSHLCSLKTHATW